MRRFLIVSKPTDVRIIYASRDVSYIGEFVFDRDKRTVMRLIVTMFTEPGGSTQFVQYADQIKARRQHQVF
jgi:hypothetical protein